MSTKKITVKRGVSKQAALAWDEGGGVNPRYRETGWVLKQAGIDEKVTVHKVTPNTAAWYLKWPVTAPQYRQLAAYPSGHLKICAYCTLSHNGIIVRHWQKPGTVLRGGRIVLDEEA